MAADDQTILFDISRLVTRRDAPAATGIDRVELAYGRHFLQRPDVQFVKTLPRIGLHAVPDAKARSLIGDLDRVWTENRAGADGGSELLRVHRRLRNEAADDDVAVERGSGSSSGGLWRQRVQLLSNHLSHAKFARPQTSNGRATYIHTSHGFLDRPSAFNWLANSGVRSVFFVHDLIPITHPEYCRPGAKLEHSKRLKTISEIASGVIVNSEHTKSELDTFLKEAGLRTPPILVAPLGLDISVSPTRAASELPPYFVCVGTLEARKNHAFLLTVWRSLVERYGADAPKLLLIGKRGWEAESAFDLIDRCEAIASHVFELGAVSNSMLAQLLRGSLGLVNPSFVEGFSYSVVEAAELGIPVIASDIPAHREVLGDYGEFVSPVDGLGWQSAILRAAQQSSEDAGSDARFKGPTWSDHFELLRDFLADLPNLTQRK
jgi:glycosyltransferase involved in cell wall biosynthesis